MDTITIIVIGLITTNLIAIWIAWREYDHSQLLRELINASPTRCAICGDDSFGHQTLSDLNLNRYIEPHEFVPAKVVYMPEPELLNKEWKDNDLRYPR